MESASALVKFSVIGLLEHGTGHELLAWAMRGGEMKPDDAAPMGEDTLADSGQLDSAPRRLASLLAGQSSIPSQA
jgi:hypothetical protein